MKFEHVFRKLESDNFSKTQILGIRSKVASSDGNELSPSDIHTEHDPYGQSAKNRTIYKEFGNEEKEQHGMVPFL